MIDPGHGGDDNGVTGAGGAQEKAVTLAVARRVKAAIEGRLGLRVLVTHEEDIARHASRIITFRDGRVRTDSPVARPLDAAALLPGLAEEAAR